ncbi:hypothetical protein DOT_0911 [Desulfosporosinus sp. OT]|nr:hypothetical protein DOT_0911 [Desulfosporosinus sp. OT]
MPYGARTFLRGDLSVLTSAIIRSASLIYLTKKIRLGQMESIG